ncbi:baseplate assembly protein [Pseudomonas folii]|uniref:Baseplate J/gp47 family protein n=1 Tax=Pseudomonas folii TaxID=2762593 RepID=A0ABR7ATK9_9PSED|nr:baseplate J/gp47 family protein [Pseudomonas folii]MBC3948242.1 baseplate J/gp47 family protein [Pseudomonas folii]MCQ2994177.1 baseplate J/gp47 family protein [Pseudomonas syringae]
MNIVDLSSLPAPDVLETLDFEDIYTEELANFRLLMGEGWSAELESDPVVKLLELAAYNKVGNRARVNDAAKALMLAYAKRADLEQLGARVNLKRLVVVAEDLTTSPPTAQVMEEDDPFRERIQMSWEGLSTAGPRNSYILHARNASGLVADATAESPSPAVVVVTVLGLDGDGSADEALLGTVRAALSDEDVRPLGDRLTVKGAEILRYTITAILHPVGTGSESEAALADAQERLAKWMNPRRRLGVEVARSAIDAQLHVAGIRRVELVGWDDIQPTKEQAAYCTSVSVTLGV